MGFLRQIVGHGLLIFGAAILSPLRAWSCTVNSASWANTGPVNAGTVVQIQISTSACDGQYFDIDIRENDGSSVNYAGAQDLGTKLKKKLVSSGQLTVPFKTFWTKDQGDADIDPEFVFRVTLWKSTSSLRDSSNILKVVPASYAVQSGLVNPSQISYQGGFALPNGNDFTWLTARAGGVKAYNPSGDPTGPNDGYPGSLFGSGHVYEGKAFEIKIPTPVNSATKSMSDLPIAQLLQGPTQITSTLWPLPQYPDGDRTITGLAYLAPYGSQTSGHLALSVASHYEYNRVSNHGLANLDLAQANLLGRWFVGTAEQINHINTNWYIMNIPQAWSNQNAPGMRLASGRYREGQIANGPSLVAFKHSDDGSFPADQTELTAKPLLLYKGPGLSGDQMNEFCYADYWSGGAWVDLNGKQAVMFIGSKGYGECWYGWEDGMRQTDCDPNCESQGYGGSNRGYSADYYRASAIFYDPSDFAKVANGQMLAFQPQPYASLDLGTYMYRQPVAGDQEIKTAGVAYDSQHGNLFITEGYNESSQRAPVHVFKINPLGGDSLPPAAPSGLRLVTQ